LRLRRHRAALHDLDRSASVAYLHHVLEQRRRVCERRALVAVESLAGRATAHVLSRGVRAADPQVRAQAIEALDALADRSLRTRLIPLLEDEPEASGPADAALAALAVDEDPWLRALAARCIDDGMGRSRSGDPASDHRAGGAPIAEHREGLMTDQIAGPEVLDRMMRLQQVPMFSQLEPEDLSRIAALCMPRAYQAEEVIYRLGDAGDEMLIIGDGRVRISVPAEGRPRVLRRFGPGEHVGELAVLRGMPRNADVIADEPVTGLIIRSTDLRSLLAGRPEVAMAMLGTLAERLGTIV
ncbi:MAG TPA: cyclic nucleotide-binding domain-containing protein, partial [Egibacteraceae bacterium]|nr:cyclic nucleotide-binding domain-containing protein [Egibacteraceae bacterium]